MSTSDASQPAGAGEPTRQDLVADRRARLARLRDELGVDPYGQRVDGLISNAQARALHDPEADARFAADPQQADPRANAHVAGRVMLHRAMGNLVFMTLRDDTDDLQIAVSKKAVERTAFNAAKIAQIGDIVVAKGPVGATKTGEVSVWCAGEQGFAIASKSLAPPPEKWHGLQDAELRYRRRYVDLYQNRDQVASVFQTRSRIVKRIRDFLCDPPGDLGPGYLEVETPMMQPIPGGAAARPFATHHNALDMQLFLRIAPELYLKRLLVGGLPRVFEINRNFRNEGVDRSHNPEFTMLELYQAFGDYCTMMELTEQLIHTLAVEIRGSASLPYGDQSIDYAVPFRRAGYHDLFAEHNGFPADDADRLADKARALHIDPAGKAHDVLLNEVWEETVEHHLVQPTFVIDYPASLCPLTRTKPGQPEIAERFELFVATMELANAYTELNDPDIQQANFDRQIEGLDDEEATFRMQDDDFVEALRVGMPPAGGMGLGIDRLVMLLTNQHSIRDVILFPLLRLRSAGAPAPTGELDQPAE